jgi:hypothetical protein
MKKQLTVALGLAVLATPAFATKARLEALGEDIFGSFYVNDNRNIFLNAAQVNNHKDLVTLEWGDTSNTADRTDSPRAEGGVFKQMGNLVYGIQLGAGSNTSNQLRAAGGLLDASSTPATPVANEENNIDVFVGGDMGFKWGAAVAYSRTKNDNTGTSDVRSEALRTRLGAIFGDTQAYANINLMNNAKGGSFGHKFEGKTGYQVGAIHQWQGYSLFADYRNFSGETDGALGKHDQDLTQLQVGAGRVTKLNDRANLFTRLSYVQGNAENELADVTLVATSFSNLCEASPFFCSDYETKRIPVVVGLEAEANSWLTLRGSITQTLWGSEELNKDERGIRNSTILAAGASLKFGEAVFDAVINQNNYGRLSMTYRF